MSTSMFSFLLLPFLCFVFVSQAQANLCKQPIPSHEVRSCSTMLMGQNDTGFDICTVKTIPANSNECEKLDFSEVQINTQIGGVQLRPFVQTITRDHNIFNYTFLNISFSDIKWNTMKFRFLSLQPRSADMAVNHCRSITISNDTAVDSRSVLYYDCYAALVETDGLSHILDFEATSDNVVNRGRYYFNMPNGRMLSPEVTEKDWKPFLYVEYRISSLRLHIQQPLFPLKIHSYKVQVMRECNDSPNCREVLLNRTLWADNKTAELHYDYDLSNQANLSDIYYFVVTPLHEDCINGITKCLSIESPRIKNIIEMHNMSICIVSVMALIVSSLLVVYYIMQCLRRRYCSDIAIPPPKILVAYPSANRLHAECVASFVNYLRADYCFDVMYDGDIMATPHADPYLWAKESFSTATVLMYIVGPNEDALNDININEKPLLPAHKDVDRILLALIKANFSNKYRKRIVNIYFEHSKGRIPIETEHGKVFRLLKDLNKLISYLTENMLPSNQIMRTSEGKCFLEDFNKAKRMMSDRTDVVIGCDKFNVFEKKGLL